MTDVKYSADLTRWLQPLGLKDSEITGPTRAYLWRVIHETTTRETDETRIRVANIWYSIIHAQRVTISQALCTLLPTDTIRSSPEAGLQAGYKLAELCETIDKPKKTGRKPIGTEFSIRVPTAHCNEIDRRTGHVGQRSAWIRSLIERELARDN